MGTGVRMPPTIGAAMRFITRRQRPCHRITGARFIHAKDRQEKVTTGQPRDTPVEISATFTTSGEFGYACGMDMFHGVMTVQ